MEKKRQRVCCCFERRRTCMVTFLLILILLGVGGYFVFPSIPKVDISEPYVPEGQSIQINGGNLADAISGRPFTLRFPTATDISVDSPSYINVGISKIEVNIKVKNRANQNINNFEGIGQVVNQRFPARTVTKFTMVFLFN
jgi:hypothetical protein